MRALAIGLALSVACWAFAGTALAETSIRGKIREDATWTKANAPYVLERAVLVERGVTLRIEPGVVVRAAGSRSALVVRGALAAEGSAGEPILFAPPRERSAGWTGIRFEAPGGPAPSVLAHVEVRGAGARPWRRFHRAASVASEVSGLSIRDSSIVDGGGEALLLAAGAVVDVARSEIRGHAGYAVWSNDADSTLSGLSESVVAGNRPDAFRVAGQLDASATWPATMPFVLERDVVVAPGVRLTLLPGAVVKGASSKTELRLRGRIVARGTPESPVVFTSAADDSAGGDTNGDGSASAPGPGGWMGITLEGFLGGGGGILEHVEIRHAGGLAWQRYGRAAGLASEVSDLVVRDARILKSAGDGVLLALGAWPTIERTEIRDCGGHAVFMTDPDSTRAALRDNAAAGNRGNGVALGGTLTRDATWRRDLPYVLHRGLDVAPGASLTIEPGVVVKAAPGACVRVLGSIAARGESGSPVAFTSLLDDSFGGDTNADGDATRPGPGDWGGIGVRSAAPGSLFRHAVVRFGGGATFFGAGATEAGLYVESPSLEIRESRIERNAHAGIRIWGGAPRILGSTITGNGIGVLATHGSAAVLDPGRENVGLALAGLTGGQGPDVAFVCTGAPAPFADAVSLVRKGGQIFLLGLCTEPVAADFMSVVMNDLCIEGSFLGRAAVPAAVDLIAQGRVNVDALVSDEIELDRVASDGFERLSTGACAACKILVRIGGER